MYIKSNVMRMMKISKMEIADADSFDDRQQRNGDSGNMMTN